MYVGKGRGRNLSSIFLTAKINTSMEGLRAQQRKILRKLRRKYVRRERKEKEDIKKSGECKEGKEGESIFHVLKSKHLQYQGDERID